MPSMPRVFSRAVADGGKHAGRAEHHIGQIIIIANTGQHYVGTLSRFGRAFGDTDGQAGIGRLPSRGAGRSAVEDGQIMPSRANMPRNRTAHYAKAKEGDFAGCAHAPACVASLSAKQGFHRCLLWVTARAQ